jgi:ubiquinone/menaquinone biosynthesis C-methylase UbiE
VTPSRLYGVDLLDERVAAAARRVPGACVRTGDARDLPFDDDSFGLVTMFTVLSAMGGPEMVNDALREVRRVARADGVALVWEPRTANPRNPATRLITKQAVARAWGEGCEAQTLTVVPALARALLGRGYHLLARIPPLRTHRLFVLRP